MLNFSDEIFDEIFDVLIVMEIDHVLEVYVIVCHVLEVYV